MTLYVFSDLHLDEEGGARLFDDRRQGRTLAALCERIAREDDAELVLLGDVFDFTSMLPPRGLERFARALDFPCPPTEERPLTELCRAIAESNPLAVRSLAALSERVRVTAVPGNHDRHLGEVGARAALDAIGLQRVRLERAVSREIAGRRVVMVHGHQWDRANAKSNGLGEALTRCLHRAIIPYLEHHGARRNVKMDVDRVVALRPEERILPTLERWLEPGDFRRLFHAFVELMAENGHLPRALARLVTPEFVHRRVEKQKPLWWTTAARATRALDGSRFDVLVAGHTHVLDWAAYDEKLYVNLGTWTERTDDFMSAPDTTLPVLALSDEGGVFGASLTDLDEGGVEMQRYRSQNDLLSVAAARSASAEVEGPA